MPFIDYFIPRGFVLERSELSIARNFVFTHLVGPILAQGMVFFLYRADPSHGFATWAIIGCIYLFPILPFLYKVTSRLDICAIISTELLTFTALFGTYFYGGASSPFLPWLIIALLLGFFYLSDRPMTSILLFSINFTGFIGAYNWFGLPEIVPVSELATLAWISILSATVYMLWMSIYYANVMSTRSEIEREAELMRRTMEMLEEQMRQAESANIACSIFLAKMSHELRTPLNAVIGYSDLLVELMEDSNTSSQKEQDLLSINAAGKHLLSLVNDILDISKIESEDIEITEEPIDLADFCKEVVATAEPLVRSNGNRFVFQGLGLGCIAGDKTKLRQVVLNLLSNAAKFTHNGTVSMLVRRKTGEGRDWIELQVIDTGIGIARSDLPKLFENYKQVSVETSAKYGGTGLGLGISQKLCALMGASITVTSELGHGSAFTVRIPSSITDNVAAETTTPMPLLNVA